MGDTRVCDCKVGRVADEFDLAGVHESLAERWVRDRDDYSLRELARYFDERVLTAAMREAGEDPLGSEVASAYDALTDDAVSSGERVQVENRLSRAGVDVDAVREAFVSHQTVHTHLRECLDVEKETGPEGDPTDRAKDTLFALQSRTEAVTESTVDSLANSSLALDDFDVLVSVSVTCAACGRSYDVGELLDRGGCTCKEP
ncbi:rod-determining factor RdfA [Haloarchaeobius amylolyticus]|uniref:rod-determining factor RdfA n=1 Tax=Haloarchaeobius amylolyticus TaxID=1198296 RepID=UPI00226FB4E4|nr:rod-determining factor RdfA [Haloarchaeobius amylolyticus]